MNAMMERRTAPRFASSYKAEIVVLTGKRIGDELLGEIVNISRTGLGLVGPEGFEVGDKLSCVVYAEDYESLCVGVIVWKESMSNRSRYGVEISRWSYLDPALDARFRARLNP